MSDQTILGADDPIYRRFADGDVERLHTLLSETPEVARFPDEFDIETLRAQMTQPGHVSVRDRWVVAQRVAPERLVGYSAVFQAPETPRADILLVTHPQVRRQGIGSELLARALADARAHGVRDAAGYVNDEDTEAAAFVQHRGFAAVGAYTSLRAPAAHTFPPAQWPAGYSIRVWRDHADLETLAVASTCGYEGLWGHNVATAEIWAQWLPQIDTRGLFFLFDTDGAVVGMARATPREKDGRTQGVIDAPGVTRALRDAGLYRPLLLHAIGWLATHNPAEYTIESWGDDPAVIEEYCSLGFRIVRRETMYDCPLTATRA